MKNPITKIIEKVSDAYKQVEDKAESCAVRGSADWNRNPIFNLSEISIQGYVDAFKWRFTVEKVSYYLALAGYLTGVALGFSGCVGCMSAHDSWKYESKIGQANDAKRNLAIADRTLRIANGHETDSTYALGPEVTFFREQQASMDSIVATVVNDPAYAVAKAADAAQTSKGNSTAGYGALIILGTGLLQFGGYKLREHTFNKMIDEVKEANPPKTGTIEQKV